MNAPRLRQPLLVLALSFAFLVPLVASASATGPGGWSNLGERAGVPGTSALDGRVDVLNSDMPGKLIAGGAFTAAGVAAGATTNDDHIAIWNGTNWSPLGAGAGLNGDVRALAVNGSKIYAAGVFNNYNGFIGSGGLAVWDTNNPGAGWIPFCSPPATAAPAALEIVGNTLYVGGPFGDWFGGPGSPADFLVACDLTSGTPTAMVDMDGDATGGVSSLAADASGDLYVGGNFINWDANTIGNNSGDYVVKYDLPSGTPSNLGVGIAGSNVDSLVTIGNDLYVGTDNQNVAGITKADSIVRWNGAAWNAVGSNTANTDGYFAAPPMSFTADVQALATDGTSVFASGNWIDANGDPLSDDIARFNGSSWNHVGSNGALNDGPFSGNLARGLAVYNGNLIAGGNFADAGGDPLADSIACFQLGATPCVPAAASATPPASDPPSTPQATPAAPVTTPAAVKCKKGQKLKHGRCVKAKKKK